MSNGPLQGSLLASTLGRPQLAVLILEVERVAHVGEDHAADADLVEDRELDLGVAQHLHVAADEEALQRRVLGLLRQRLDHRAERPRREAADVVDAAHEVALEDRHAVRIAAGDEPALELQAEHERPPDRIEEARRRLVAREDVLRQQEVVGDLARDRVVPAARGEHAVVARVVRDQARPDDVMPERSRLAIEPSGIGSRWPLENSPAKPPVDTCTSSSV